MIYCEFYFLPSSVEAVTALGNKVLEELKNSDPQEGKNIC